ncbi:MAG: hypothetical protein A2505_09775 [Deltaproteobacteria bacterium RIFOXYD12_FULL_55_16]|nr:MAG: hypothetical protein A2505_09775 [Deltaproteobacteria bacterium RIFOXYD12_FULL_55_16]
MDNLNATKSGVIPIFSIISYLVSTTGEPKKAEKAARENLCGLTNTLTGTNHALGGKITTTLHFFLRQRKFADPAQQILHQAL